MKRTKIELSKRPELKEIYSDHMPEQVAAEMLASPIRLNNTMRKTCREARSKYYAAAVPRKPIEPKIAARLKVAKLAQLGKWLRRTVERRAAVQRAFVRTVGETPIQDRIRAALELRAANYDIFREAIEDELFARLENVSKVVAEHREHNGRLHCWQRKTLLSALHEIQLAS